MTDQIKTFRTFGKLISCYREAMHQKLRPYLNHLFISDLDDNLSGSLSYDLPKNRIIFIQNNPNENHRSNRTMDYISALLDISQENLTENDSVTHYQFSREIDPISYLVENHSEGYSKIINNQKYPLYLKEKGLFSLRDHVILSGQELYLIDSSEVLTIKKMELVPEENISNIPSQTSAALTQIFNFLEKVEPLQPYLRGIKLEFFQNSNTSENNFLSFSVPKNLSYSFSYHNPQGYKIDRHSTSSILFLNDHNMEAIRNVKEVELFHN